MDEHPRSLVGQVQFLRDAGYTSEETWRELKRRPMLGKVTHERVKELYRQLGKRTLDSQRIYEIWEMLAEVLAILREVKDADPVRVAARIRQLERGMPCRLRAALENTTAPEWPETPAGS